MKKCLLVLVSILFSLYPLYSETLALVGGTLLDVSDFGNSKEDIHNSVILIDGETITAVGNKASVKIPPGTRIIDVRGKYVLPGLFDGYAALENQAFANAYLYMGITSIVGVSGYKRSLLYTEANPSPYVYLCGDVGHFEVSTQEMLEQIETNAAKGVKFLLLMYALKPEQLKPAIEKAHEHGMVTIGEFVNISYKDAISRGIDAVIHFTRYSVELAPEDMRIQMAEQPFGPAAGEFRLWLAGIDPNEKAILDYAEVLGSSPVGLLPTLAVSCIDYPKLENPWKEPIAAILDPGDINNPVEKSTGKHKYDAEAFEIITRAVENFLKIEGRNFKAGAKYLAGSGNDINGTLPGISLHTELELLTMVGLSERQALAAATGNYASIFNWTEAGQIKPGSRADILVIEKNPLENIQNLKDISLVLLKGKILDREKLLRN